MPESAATIAKLLDLSERHVRRLSAQGVIPRLARGEYSFVAAVQGYVKYLRAQLTGDGDFEAHRARLYNFRARLAEIEIKRLEGLLVSLEDAERAWAYVVSAFRAKMLSIPSKVAVALAEISDPRQVRARLEAEIHEALEELSNDNAVAAGALRDNPQSPCDSEAAAPSDGSRVG